MVIRSIIFFVAGLISVIFPKKVFKFQVYILKKLRIKSWAKTSWKDNVYIGFGLIVIGVVILLIWG